MTFFIIEQPMVLYINVNIDYFSGYSGLL